MEDLNAVKDKLSFRDIIHSRKNSFDDNQNKTVSRKDSMAPSEPLKSIFSAFIAQQNTSLFA